MSFNSLAKYLIRKQLHKFWQVILKALQQGMTPNKLAFTCALGAVLSVFPVYGSTTLLCLAAAALLRLNVMVILAVNYLLTPVQLLVLIPLLQGGAYVFQLNTVLLDYSEFVLRFKNDFASLISDFGFVLLAGMAFWLVIAIPLFFMLYYSVFYFLKQIRKKELEELSH